MNEKSLIHSRRAAVGSRSTFGELLDVWLKESQERCKASTYAAYSQRAEKHLRPVLGNIRLKQLTEADFRSVTEAMNGLSSATKHGVICVLRQILDYGRELGCRIGPDAEYPRQHAEPVSITVLNTDEIARLEQVLENEASLRSLGLRLCLYTGLRLGEICGLRWGDIAPDGQTLRIQRTVQRLRRTGGGTELRLDTPKSGSSVRSIPIPQTLAAELNALRRDPAICLLTGTERYMDPRTYQFYFRRTLERAGVRTVNFHILRHTFATRCIDLGLDAKSLSRVLGHADVSTTLNIYVHPDQNRLRECQERMLALALPAKKV